jgi:DNA-binding transcriptional LysR family regulator
VPRIRRFMAAHPDIELVIETASRHVDLDTEAFDAAIHVGDGGWPGLVAMRLMEIRATPVATADLVRQLDLRRPADLARATLIHVTTFPLAWPIWLEKARVSGLTPRHAIWVDGFNAALQLAEQGAGVALGLEPLIADRERRGVLCRPLPVSQPTGGYWLVHRKGDAGHAGLRAFKRWLETEITDG